ncbi:MAG: nitroreductase family protein [Coriobacteriia bacterium]
MELKDAMQQRHSIRAFTNERIDRATVERLVEAAMLAPSAMNRQPWRFHVATGEARRGVGEVMAQTTVFVEEYAAALGPEHVARAIDFYANDLGGAPIALAVSLPVGDGEMDRLNALISLGCALENLFLACVAEGLGTCMLSVAFWVRDQLAEVLDVPDGWEITTLVVIGRPCEAAIAPVHRTDLYTYQE